MNIDTALAVIDNALVVLSKYWACLAPRSFGEKALNKRTTKPIFGFLLF
jgi:hypothetical protein